MLVVGRMRVGDVVPVGDGWDATVYGTDERETFTRRRAATRWLLARAAGRAEVPRVRRLPRHGWDYDEPRQPPKGWRVAHTGRAFISGEPVTIYERNRRRR